MSRIYVLQKEVPGLGRLTKVGMTTRSGEDRAAEYGGGKWDVVDEVEVAVEDVAALKDLEGRIHARLEAHRCHPAANLGLTEVFTCSAAMAVEAAKAEIGSQATDMSRVEMLRKRTDRAVERKILQHHAAELAKLHLGKFPKREYGSLYRDIPMLASREDAALFQIHVTALAALDRIDAPAETFREMVGQDLERLRKKWTTEATRRERQEAEEKRLQKERAARERDKQQREFEKQQAATVARYDALAKLKSSRDRRTTWRVIGWTSVVGLIVVGYDIRERWTQGGEIIPVQAFWLAAFVFGAVIGFFLARSATKRLKALEDAWERDFPGEPSNQSSIT